MALPGALLSYWHCCLGSINVEVMGVDVGEAR